MNDDYPKAELFRGILKHCAPARKLIAVSDQSNLTSEADVELTDKDFLDAARLLTSFGVGTLTRRREDNHLHRIRWKFKNLKEVASGETNIFLRHSRRGRPLKKHIRVTLLLPPVVVQGIERHVQKEFTREQLESWIENLLANYLKSIELKKEENETSSSQKPQRRAR